MIDLPLGLDIGYNAVKAVHGKPQTTFPSFVGTADISSFSLNAGNDVVIEHEGKSYLVGESAILQSRFSDQNEDRRWFESTEYLILYFAALSALCTSGKVNIITGLPVSYLDDKEFLENRLNGTWSFSRNGKQFDFETSVKVKPQPVGTLLDLALDSDGDIENLEYASGRIGIIDIGGKTTNFLSVYRLADISKETTSIEIGGWNVVTAVQEYLKKEFPKRGFRDHEIAECVKSKSISYYGEKHDISKAISDVCTPFARNVISEATKKWNGAAHIDKIVITGGGSYLLGSQIMAHFPHAIVHKNPVFGNALGFYKLGVYYANKQQ